MSIKWLGLVIDAVGRLPLEKWLIRAPDTQDRLVKLKDILQPQPRPEPEPIDTSNQEVPELDEPLLRPRRVHLEQSTSSGVSNKETIDYQNREIGKLLLRMERHLAQKMRINGVACDCGAPKHLLDLEAMTEETIPMVDDPAIFNKIMEWIAVVGPKTTLESAKSGRYDNDYQVHSREARDLRKELMGTLDSDALFPQRVAVIGVSDPGAELVKALSDSSEVDVQTVPVESPPIDKPADLE